MMKTHTDKERPLYIYIYLLLVTSSSYRAKNPAKSRAGRGNVARYLPLLFNLREFAGIRSTEPHRASHLAHMQIPETAMEFVRIIGLSATLTLVDCAKSSHREKRHRSYRIRVPVGDMSDDHAIVRTLGRVQAEIVHRHFAGETMAFPSRRIRAIKRDIQIARDHIQGIPVPVLAESHGVSERTVIRALGRISHGDIKRAGAPPPPPVVGSSAPTPMRVTRTTSLKG